MSGEARRAQRRCWARMLLIVIALVGLIRPAPLVADEWVIKSADLELEVLDTEAALTDLVTVAVVLGGNVVSGTKWRVGANMDATVTLAVPPQAFDEALRRLRVGVAVVRKEEVVTEDAGERLTTIGSDIHALEAAAARLRSLAEQAQPGTEAASAQRELASLDGRVAELEARRANLAGRAAEARLNLDIRERRATSTPTHTITPVPTRTATSTRTVTPTRTATPIPPTPIPWNPARTFQEARTVQQVVFANLGDVTIRFGVVCLPFLGPGVLIWLLWRISRRRSTKKG